MDSAWNIPDVVCEVHITGEMSIQQPELQGQKRRKNNILKGRETGNNQFLLGTYKVSGSFIKSFYLILTTPLRYVSFFLFSQVGGPGKWPRIRRCANVYSASDRTHTWVKSNSRQCDFYHYGSTVVLKKEVKGISDPCPDSSQ